ncbi:hypothetical protein BTUL_0050g00620 [Botrytis tulipae]|uniref:Uncharacterized protein n=1 Tax=Botrytis tulipae TaxID=87230 RepID=A0A4Z1F0T0_9HELO|nr:hypothetical protein BTUL_0050g00620 [Botrytis tulipae]
MPIDNRHGEKDREILNISHCTSIIVVQERKFNMRTRWWRLKFMDTAHSDFPQDSSDRAIRSRQQLFYNVNYRVE